MYRNKFLDAWDEKCFELLVFLNNNSGINSKEACLSYLHISPKTLTKIYESLVEISAETGFFELENTQNHLKLTMAENNNMTDVFFHILLRSFKYKIIHELFNKNELQTVRLEHELGISHATLYRKLEDLKEILSAFKLKINHGELQGSELQIRHFFLEYCITSIPYDVLERELADQQLVNAIVLFKKTLEVNLDTEAELKLIIYLSMIRKRYHQNKIDLSELEKQYPFFENDHNSLTNQSFLDLFNQSELKKTIDIFFKNLGSLFKINLSDKESDLLILFALGNNIFPLNSAVFNNVIKIQSQSQSITEKIVADVLEELTKDELLEDGNFILYNYVRSLLNVICWNQEIYHGGIYMYDDLDFEKFVNLKKLNKIQTYINNFLVDSFPEFTKDELQNKKFLVNLLLISLYSANHSDHSYKVGVTIKGDIMYRMLIEKQIINRINSMGYVNAELLDFNNSYDLIISNVNLPELKNSAREFYLLNHQFTPHDFSALEEIIEKNALTKKDSTD